MQIPPISLTLTTSHDAGGLVALVVAARQDGSMAPRLASLLPEPIAFAHRGARAHAPENTFEAFHLAVKLGATGLESDVWSTADGHGVLVHDGEIGRWPKKRRIDELRRDQLPSFIPTIEEFYDQVGTERHVSLDLKDPAAFQCVVDAARNAGGDAEAKLWLCHPMMDQLVAWRHDTSARLVNSTRLSRMKEGPERRANALRDAGIDAVNMRFTDWTGGLVTLFHRYERAALGWDAQHAREIASLIDSGIDGVFSDHVDRLVGAIRQFFPAERSTEGPAS